MSVIEENRVRVGDYVVVQKQTYRKLCRVTENGTLTLGKEQIEVKGIIDKPFWTTFKMIKSKTNKKMFTLEVAERAETSEELRKALTSGMDNRTIMDDGKSQKLSKEEIEDLRESGKSSNEIVGRLIENSKSFAAKTEYSQDKYIKKKERKYFRFLTIRQPTIDILQDIYFRQDYTRISCLRMDALAQILAYCDVKADGIYMIYDSGSMGLPASAMLNRIGADTSGIIIYLHPGNQAQNTLIQAMNFPGEQMERLLTVNLYSFLRFHYQGESAIMEEISWKSSLSAKNGSCNGSKSKKSMNNENSTDTTQQAVTEEAKNLSAGENVNPPKRKQSEDCVDEKKDESSEDPAEEKGLEVGENVNPMKRKQSDEGGAEIAAKKPKWLLETGRAVELCGERKVEGLVVIAKEHPLNVIKALLKFLGTSRPFVIYHCYREPLQETYVALKQRGDIVNLRLFSNFLRSYQVLPNRTHPDIMMNDLGGYLLTGYLVN